MKSDNYKVLFIGDIVGRPGRKCVKRYLAQNKSKYDLVIANVENASHGFGLTKKNHDDLLEYGVDIMTSGNHIWDKKDILEYINESKSLIRPYNYHKSLTGVGYRIFNDKVIVANFLGRTFMSPIDCPFATLENLINELKEKNIFENKIIIVDFHAEASAEKQSFAYFAKSLGVNVVIGTHTHVQTADETIFDNFAYITDAGFCGSKYSIIGMKYEISLKRLITSVSERFDVEDSLPYIFNACEVEFSANCVTGISRISFEYSDNEEENGEN